ncbi:MAG: formate--tetrahydrofolate ligase [Deltaproteobacteria bacterium HGW-Deltaproteobacteria-3]|nr:MAG: formate--tetrahydrofolate ligase [Deltaproteobacteria bacterium HGW-Deltaproteobacteria-3]
MAFDAVNMPDWQISEAAEKNMPTPEEWRDRLGLEKDEILPMGRLAKLDFLKIMNRLKDKPDGKYIEVTAITPTPLGEGKSTTSCGLMEGLGKRGKNVGGALRQPSGGPTMNVKGTAAGGGNSLLIPMTEFSLGLTGDINDIMNAHNLGMVAMTARMQHERNYNDEQLARLTGMRRLDIDPTRVEFGWIIDFCAQALRNIVIGLGGRTDGYTMQSKFGIAVGSELMAILSIATDLADLKERINNITVAFDKSGKPVTCRDLEVGNAMAAFMRNTINPTLMCTAEYNPCLVHAGPFANIAVGQIAVGQSSIIADRVALKLFDYNITESGFAADIGFEKFWNVKCRYSGLKPHVSVLTATIRALKMHGGGPKVVPGKPLDDAYTKENIELVEKGCENMVHLINVIRKAGINPVVCINRFYSDTDAECKVVRRIAEAAGARCAESKHWELGGDGALEFADAVIDACNEENDFKFLYPLEMKLRDRVEMITKEVYGGDGVDWSSEALAKAKMLESDPQYADYATMMVFRRIDVDPETGKVSGLF